MIKKKIFVLVVTAVVIAISVAAILSFKYWFEPKAKYVKTDNPKLLKIRKDLTGLKAELKEEGVYNCCIKNECNWCALYMGHCPCGELMSKEGQEKSCPECAAAWNRKLGKTPGVDPDAIGVTTFGIYGYEKDGHHYPSSKESKAETEDAHSSHTDEHHH